VQPENTHRPAAEAGTAAGLGTDEQDVVELAAEIAEVAGRAGDVPKPELDRLLRHAWWTPTMRALTEGTLTRSATSGETLAGPLAAVLGARPEVVASLEPKQRRIYQLLSADRSDLASMLPDVPGGTYLKGRRIGADDLQRGFDLAQQIVRSSAPERLVTTIYEAHLLRHLIAVVDSADDAEFAELAAITGRFADRLRPYVLHADFWPWAGSLTAALAHSVEAARAVVRLGETGRFSLVQERRGKFLIVPEAAYESTPAVSTVFLNRSTLVENVVQSSPGQADGVPVPRAVITRPGNYDVFARLDVPGVLDLPLTLGADNSEQAARVTVRPSGAFLSLKTSPRRRRNRSARPKTGRPVQA